MHLRRNVGFVYYGSLTLRNDMTIAPEDREELQTYMIIMYALKHIGLSTQNHKFSKIIKTQSGADHYFYQLRLLKPLICIYLVKPRDKHSPYCTGEVVQERTSTSTVALHAMISVDIQSANGLNPKVIFHLIKMYSIPRFIYGLDVIRIPSKHMFTLTSSYKNMFEQMKYVSKRTSDAIACLVHYCQPTK